jgi:DNA-binding protein YbaB
MFDQMKAMGAVAGLLRNKEKMREIGDRVREGMDRLSVTGSSGGGAVRVTVSGRMRVTGVALDPAVIAGLGTGDGGRAMVESLVKDATNEALERAQAVMQEEIRRIAREFDLPDIPGMDRMLGGG